MAVDPLHLRASGLVISEGLTMPLPQFREAALFGSGAGAAVAVSPFKCFLFPDQPYLSPIPSCFDLLSTFALLDDTLNAIHSTIRTRDFSICCNVVSLHHIASNLSSPARSAGLRRPPLDGFRISIAVHTCSRLSAFFRAGIVWAGRWRSIGAAGLN
jgi:hypothetical protein